MTQPIQGEGGYQSIESNTTQPFPSYGSNGEAHTSFVQYGATSTVVEAVINTDTIQGSNPLYGEECDRADEDPDMGWLTKSSVDFSDIVKEQKGTETVEEMKPVHEMVYHITRDWFYKILVLLTGVLLAFTCGLIFASCSYVTNWLWTPFVRFSKRFVYALAIWHRAVLRGAFGPFYGGFEFLWNAIRYFRSSSHIIGAVVESAH